MTTEPQYHSFKSQGASTRLLSYAGSDFQEKSNYRPPVADPIGRIAAPPAPEALKLSYYVLNAAYFDVTASGFRPKKLLVPRALFDTITKMIGYNETTNRLHFFTTEELVANYRPSVDHDRSVYVEIDGTNKDSSFSFK